MWNSNVTYYGLSIMCTHKIIPNVFSVDISLIMWPAPTHTHKHCNWAKNKWNYLQAINLEGPWLFLHCWNVLFALLLNYSWASLAYHIPKLKFYLMWQFFFEFGHPCEVGHEKVLARIKFLFSPILDDVIYPN